MHRSTDAQDLLPVGIVWRTCGIAPGRAAATRLDSGQLSLVALDLDPGIEADGREVRGAVFRLACHLADTAPAFLPTRFGLLNRAQATRWLEEEEDHLLAQLDYVSGHSEIVVSLRRDRPATSANPEGYLRRRAKEQADSRIFTEGMYGELSTAIQPVERMTRAHKLRSTPATPGGRTCYADASLLVARPRCADVAERLRATLSERPGMALAGPLPAYSFCESEAV